MGTKNSFAKKKRIREKKVVISYNFIIIILIIQLERKEEKRKEKQIEKDEIKNKIKRYQKKYLHTNTIEEKVKINKAIPFSYSSKK